MSNQIVISSGAKVRSLEGVLTGTAGIVNSVPLGGANGVATLDSNGKVPLSQLPASVVTYLGTWNASTNTPTLTNGVGDVGDLYICNVAGTVNFGAGPITFAVGDWVIYNGSQWQKSAGASGTVTSVAVTESGDALTITGSPITTAGTINIGFAGTSTQYIAGNGTLVTFPSIISEAQNLVTEVYNNSGATIAKGSVVYINGGQGNLPTITKAQADTEVASNQTIGLVRADITNMNNGYVTVAGRLENLDTQAYSVGTTLYLSPSVAGGYTSTKPTSPDHIVYVGIIVRSHPTQGVIEVKIQNTQELAESSDVLITSPANNEGLFYDGTSSLWKNKTIANVLGYTPANDALVVHLAGTETITGAKTFTGGASFTLAGGVVGFSGGIAVDKGNAITKGSTPASFSPASTTLYSALGDNNLVLRDSTNTSILQFQASSSYTYTFPAATGTLALSSDLSSYVPYIGATADVDLGTRYFKATGVQTESAFALKILTAGIAFQNGYSVMSSLAGTFSITQAVSAGNLKSMTFNFSAWATNSSYTYTLPAANGTIALTSNLSSYVPYAGATSSLNLGTNDVSSKFVFVEGDGTQGGILSIRQYAASYSVTTDHTNIYAIGNTKLNWSFFQVGGNNKIVSFDVSSITNAVTRTYTLPDATGTLALTSDLGNYVTLDTTQTITGAKTFTTGVTKFRDVYVEGSGTSASGVNLKQSSGGIAYAGAGYMTINAFGTKQIGILDGATQTNAYISLNSITSGISRTYTLPDANGTLALTSNLSAYLPLTGGTLTGGLYINPTNTGVTGLDVASNNTSFRSDNLEGSKRQLLMTMGSGTLISLTGKGYEASRVTDIAFYTSTSGGVNSTPSIYMTGAGNVGIGTGTSPVKFTIANADTRIEFDQLNSTTSYLEAINTARSTTNYFAMYTRGLNIWTRPSGTGTYAQTMTITDAGNVGIGTSSPNALLHLSQSTSNLNLYLQNTLGSGKTWAVNSDTNGNFNIHDTTANRLTITSGGQVCINQTSASAANYNLNVTGNGGVWVKANNSGDAGFVSQGGVGFHFYSINSGGANTFQVLNNGDVKNANNSYGVLSDIKLKENIVDASPKLNDLMKVRIVNYNLKKDLGYDSNKQIGVIAQELEDIFPSLIDETIDKDDNGQDLETKTKSVKMSVFIPILIKAIQELSAKVSALENK